MNRRRGFTLIELLTVIAIIAILSAIIFPVYMRAKDAAFRNSDLSNMNALRSALQLYRADQGGYPPALLGYVSKYQSGPNIGNVIPADQLKAFLYPRRVDSIKTFQPSNDRFATTATTTAVWPNQDPRALGSAPILDLNGDGQIDTNDDLPGARQAYGPSTVVTRTIMDPSTGLPVIVPSEFYSVSGYDVAQVPAGAGGTQFELRYALFWTLYALGDGSGNAPWKGGGDAQDDPRQLGYDDPPENTVVTWDSYFREYQGSVAPTRTKRDIVLFLGGSARPYDSMDIYDRSWRVLP